MIVATITITQSVSSHPAMLGKVSSIFSIGLLTQKQNPPLISLFLLRSPRIKWRRRDQKPSERSIPGGFLWRLIRHIDRKQRKSPERCQR